MTELQRYRVPTDRAYEPESHLWVQRVGTVVRVGLDELGSETSGDLAFLQLATPGTLLERGSEMGSMEAGKFVGPILSPIRGTVRAVNPAVLRNPRLVNTDPLEEGWLMEVELADDEALEHLLVDPAEIEAWFAERLRDYRLRGVLAE